VKLMDRLARIQSAAKLSVEGPDRPLFTLARPSDCRYALADYEPPPGFRLPLATQAELEANAASVKPRMVVRLGFALAGEEGGLIRNPAVALNAKGLTLFPAGFEYVFELSRIKVAHGGRDSGKSWNYARALLLLATASPLQVYCCREWQNSMRDSVHKLLREQIVSMRLSRYFEVQQQIIRGHNGALFAFVGLANDPAGIKSAESFDVAWIEEAYAISKDSWTHLEPTIRRNNAEIWITFNPDEERDYIYQKFVANTPPPDAVVKQFNWQQNPWVSETLRVGREHMLATDPELYRTVYGGLCKQFNSSVIFGGKYERGVLAIPEDRVIRNREGWDGPYYGFDWGFSADPTVLIKVYLKGKDILYIEKEWSGVGVELDDIGPRCLEVMPEARNCTARGDNSRPETISHVRAKSGINIVAAEKWKGSIEDGIAWLKSHQRIVVHPSCKRTYDELGKYSYKRDRRTQEITSDIEDRDNHCIDALRYALEPYVQRSGSAATMFNWRHLNDPPGYRM
jgi:phage terminase large subunit